MSQLSLQIEVDSPELLLEAEEQVLQIEVEAPELTLTVGSCELSLVAQDPTELSLALVVHELSLVAAPAELLMGIPFPGEVNTGANVGGEQEVFRDKVGSVLNFRTLAGPGEVKVEQVDDVINISEKVKHDEQDQLVHDVVENSFTEYVYAGNRVTRIEIWTDAGKTIRIRTEDFSYTGNRVTTIVTQHYDAAGVAIVGQKFTETLVYDGSRVDDIVGVKS